VFDHSNSLIGSESEMTRVCARCTPLISFQERCIVIDQVQKSFAVSFAFSWFENI
jgi:hypothetical protein